MKKFILLFLLCSVGFVGKELNAQISFSLNITSQPLWGPVGYDYVEYYYIPEIEVYYYVPRQEYVYMVNGRWVRRLFLPHRYRRYDLYGATKYVINEPNPYQHHHHNKQKYKPSGGRSGQGSIRDSRDSKYYQHKKHPQHSQWKKSNHNGSNKNKNDDQSSGKKNRKDSRPKGRNNKNH